MIWPEEQVSSPAGSFATHKRAAEIIMGPTAKLPEQGNKPMKPAKTFKVFGETVEVLVTTEATSGSFCITVQTSPPGGGPPPHSHKNEDEIFTIIEGEYEIFDGRQWNKLPAGEHVQGLRNHVHTFRNSGKTMGKLLCIAVPGGLDHYLEAISPLELPRDLERLTEISDAHGIAFIAPEPSAT
jgi:uncharacterized cupin superfamily protein